MDRETSLSQMVLGIIPRDGATWGDIKRSFPQFAPWTVEAVLKGLLAARVLVRVNHGEFGIFMRAEDAPKQPKDLSSIEGGRPSPLKLPPLHKRAGIFDKYDKRGWRLCTALNHYLPINQFGSGHSPDKLHSWCRSCKRSRAAQARRAAEL